MSRRCGTAGRVVAWWVAVRAAATGCRPCRSSSGGTRWSAARRARAPRRPVPCRARCSTEPAGARAPSLVKNSTARCSKAMAIRNRLAGSSRLAVDAGENGGAIELEIRRRRRHVGVVALDSVSMCSFSIAAKRPKSSRSTGPRRRARRAGRRHGRRARSRRPCGWRPAPGRRRSRRGRASRACRRSAGTCRRGRRSLRSPWRSRCSASAARRRRSRCTASSSSSGRWHFGQMLMTGTLAGRLGLAVGADRRRAARRRRRRPG